MSHKGVLVLIRVGSFKILCESRRLMMLDTTMCSNILKNTDVKYTGR